MKKTVKILAYAILFIICAMFIFRCCMAADKSKFSKLEATDALRDAYADGVSEMFSVKIEREMSEDGYFSAYGFYYNSEVGEVQLAVRWNDSVYDYTDMEKGHEFSFYLLNETTGEKYPMTAVGSSKFSFYNYRKLTADGVSVENDEQLTVIMELRDGYESRQIIKYDEQPFKNYSPSKSFIKKLAE